MDNPFKAWDDYYELSHKWRGEIINYSISMEQAIEIFISRQFIRETTESAYNEKMNDFRRLFFWNTQMGLSRKKQIAMDLINTYQKEFILTHPDTESDLTRIIKCRNDMAHWELDIDGYYRWNGAKNKEIKVNKISNSHTTIYNEQSIKEIVDLCRKYYAVFYYWY